MSVDCLRKMNRLHSGRLRFAPLRNSPCRAVATRSGAVVHFWGADPVHQLADRTHHDPTSARPPVARAARDVIVYRIGSLLLEQECWTGLSSGVESTACTSRRAHR
jgi:hypothetical protein